MGDNRWESWAKGEIERLQAENERLQHALNTLNIALSGERGENHALRTAAQVTVERLQTGAGYGEVVAKQLLEWADDLDAAIKGEQAGE